MLLRQLLQGLQAYFGYAAVANLVSVFLGPLTPHWNQQQTQSSSSTDWPCGMATIAETESPATTLSWPWPWPCPLMLLAASPSNALLIFALAMARRKDWPDKGMQVNPSAFELGKLRRPKRSPRCGRH